MGEYRLQHTAHDLENLITFIDNHIADKYDATDGLYNQDDVVLYNFKLYKCLLNSVSGAWDSTKWAETKIIDPNDALIIDEQTNI